MLKTTQIQDQNPWWSGVARLEELKWPKRSLYQKLEKQLNNRLILSILGLRRLGKSTLLKQLIGHLIRKKINPKRIFYFSFDQKMIIKTPDVLEEAIEKYFQEILVQVPSTIKQKVYILLDEIQYIDYWQDIIKRYYDMSSNIKFILTGSQSAILKSKSKESLAGRILEYKLNPLSFDEFLNISTLKVTRDNYLANAFKIQENFPKILQENYIKGTNLEKLSKIYLMYGQFPELAQPNNFLLKDKYNYIRESIIGKILEKDIPMLFEIEKVAFLKIIAQHLIENSSSLMETKNLARDLGLNRITTENYLEYLKLGLIIDILYRYSKSKIKQGRLLKKTYTLSPNFICALGRLEEIFYNKAPEVFGKIIETHVFNKLNQQAKKFDYDLSFFRQREKEIDFILANKNSILPIEVKFKANIRQSDYNFLIEYCRDKKINHAILITKNLLEKKKINNITLFFIPYYFL